MWLTRCPVKMPHQYAMQHTLGVPDVICTIGVGKFPSERSENSENQRKLFAFLNGGSTRNVQPNMRDSNQRTLLGLRFVFLYENSGNPSWQQPQICTGIFRLNSKSVKVEIPILGFAMDLVEACGCMPTFPTHPNPRHMEGNNRKERTLQCQVRIENPRARRHWKAKLGLHV